VTTEGTEKPTGMSQFADQEFGLRNLASGNAGFGAETERDEMIEGVIADPVALGVGAFDKIAPIAKFISKDEESGFEVVTGKSVEDDGRHIGVGTIVKSNRDAGHLESVQEFLLALDWHLGVLFDF
jgi:hypothetical protein